MTPPRPRLDLDAMAAEFRPKVAFKVRRSLGASHPDWEDIVNEVLTQAVEKIRSGEFRGDSSVGTFIYTITLRRIADFIRRKGRILSEAPQPGIPMEPSAAVELDERLERLARAVRELKPKYKDVLELYYYQGLSREETGRRLGLKPARVSERVNYAQKLLRKRLSR